MLRHRFGSPTLLAARRRGATVLRRQPSARPGVVVEPTEIALGPGAAVLALAWTAVRLRRPPRRRWDIALVELVSSLLAVSLLTGLAGLDVTGGWRTSLPPASLYATFGVTLATTVSSLVRTVRVWPARTAADGTPLVAIVSFAASSAAAAGASAAMLLSAEGPAVLGLVAAVTVSRLYLIAKPSRGPRPMRGPVAGSR